MNKGVLWRDLTRLVCNCKGVQRHDLSLGENNLFAPIFCFQFVQKGILTFRL